MYFPVKLFLHPRDPTLVVEQNKKISIIVNMEEVEKELGFHLTLITSAALNCLSLRNTSPSFAKHLGFSDEASSLSMEWKWSSFEKKSLESSLTCMIKLVHYLENYGKNRFPELFIHLESSGSQAIRRTLQSLDNLVQKEQTKKDASNAHLTIPTPSISTTSKFLGKRKAEEASTSTHLKKQKFFGTHSSMTAKDETASLSCQATAPLPVVASTSISLLTANPENIGDSDEEDNSKPKTPFIDSCGEAVENLLLFPRILEQKKQETLPLHASEVMPLSEVIPSIPSSKFQTNYTYIFSVVLHANSSESQSNRSYQLSYVRLSNQRKNKLNIATRESFIRTLKHISKLLQTTFTEKVFFTHPKTLTNSPIIHPTTLWQILLEGLLENQYCFNEYAHHLIYHPKHPELHTMLQSTIDTLQTKCPPNNKTRSTTLISLINKEQSRNKTYIPLFNVPVDISNPKSPSLPIVKITEPTTACSSVTPSIPTTSTTPTTAVSVEEGWIILPFFSIRKKKIRKDTAYVLAYGEKYNSVNTWNIANKVRTILEESLQAYEEIVNTSADSPTLFITWIPYTQKTAIGINKETALSLIARGFRHIINFYLKNSSPLFKQTSGELLLKTLQKILQELAQQQLPVIDHHPSYHVKDSIMEDLVTSKHQLLSKQTTTSVAPTTKPSSSDKLTLYLFVIWGQSRKKSLDGLFSNYCIAYISKDITFKNLLYKKCRESIINTTQHAITLLQLGYLESTIKFQKNKTTKKVSVQSFEELRDIIFQGLQELKLFFNQYAPKVLNPTLTLDPRAALDDAIATALNLYPPESLPLQKTHSTTLVKLMGNKLGQHTQEPLPDISSSSDEDVDSEEK